MSKGFKHGAGGGGSGGLNFEVVAYATEEELTVATPKENAICVITSDKITSWLFSATEPEAPEEGMVWISIGTSSTVAFSATKKNPIMVYPLFANQYIGGEWVGKTAKSWQDGQLVDWTTYLYNLGNEYLDITGGWQSVAKNWEPSTSNPKAHKLTKNETSMVISNGGGSGGSGVVIPFKPIDLTNYNRLVANITGSGFTVTNQFQKLAVWPVGFSYAWSGGVTAHTALQNGTYDASLDVSALTGEYYVGFLFYTTNGTDAKSITVHNVRLER